MKPMEERNKNGQTFLPKDSKQRMDLSGCMLLSEETLQVEESVNRVDDMMNMLAASKDSMQMNTTTNNVNRTPRSASKLTSAEIYNLKVDDVYASGK